jgi:glycosyltransferase involved in cell wall biosynthesis
MTLQLLASLVALRPDVEFILLTASQEPALTRLGKLNVREVFVGPRTPPGRSTYRSPRELLFGLAGAVAPYLPDPLLIRLKSVYRSVFYRHPRSSLLTKLGADLYFSPLGSTRFYMQQIPFIAVVYDVQHRQYPQFFSHDVRYFRDRQLEEIASRASCVVTISNYSFRSIKSLPDLTFADLRVISPPRPPIHQENVPSDINAVLDRHGVRAGRFLVYPANLWPHKNHEMTLLAFSIYKRQYPNSDLKLLCTGAGLDRIELLKDETSRMGLADVVAFTGYVDRTELDILIQEARALLFLSLYEGFGIPLLEAMQVGTPVVASNTTSLPEIAGDAALLVDPRRPDVIANAIAQIDEDGELRELYTRRGRERVLGFPTRDAAASSYAELFEEFARSGGAK